MFSCYITLACILHAQYTPCALFIPHTHTHTVFICIFSMYVNIILYALNVPYVGLCLVLHALFVLYASFVVCVYVLHAIYVLRHSMFYIKSMFDTHFVFYTTCLFSTHSLLWFYLICLHIYLLQILTPSSEARCFQHILVIILIHVPCIFYYFVK